MLLSKTSLNYQNVDPKSPIHGEHFFPWAAGIAFVCRAPGKPSTRFPGERLFHSEPPHHQKLTSKHL